MRALTRLGLVLAGALLMGGLTAIPAGAHAELTSTDPADGSSLSAPPAQVTLTFGETLVPETVTIAVSTQDGAVAGIAPRTEGDTVTVPWPAEAGAGDYTVAYRVVSEDGHPVEGQFAFSIAATEASSAAVPDASSVASPVAEATPATVASEAPYEPTGPEDGSIDWVLVIVVMAFGVAAFSALLVAGRRNARRKW